MPAATAVTVWQCGLSDEGAGAAPVTERASGAEYAWSQKVSGQMEVSIMRKMGIIVVVLAIAAAIGGSAAAAASAEGPIWRVNGVELKAGETIKTAGRGTLSFVVNGLTFTVSCESLTDKTELFGGQPGRDEDHLKYSNCMVVGKLSTCTPEEPIDIETNTILVYLIRAGAGEKWKPATEAEWIRAGERSERRAYGDEFQKEGEDLFKVKINGASCAVKGTYKAVGSYRGLVVGGLEFTDESSELEVNGKGAFATGLLEYWPVNEAGEATGQTLEVAQ